MTRVELLFFPGCPGHPLAAAAIAAALEGAGPVEVVEVEVRAETAAALRFLGSPSVRVDGLDVEPAARARVTFGMQCRVYEVDGALQKAPPSSWITAALRAADATGPRFARAGAEGQAPAMTSTTPAPLVLLAIAPGGDNDAASAAVTAALQTAGYDVVGAVDGDEVLATLKNGIWPQVLVADVGLPKVASFDTWLDDTPAMRALPVILWTTPGASGPAKSRPVRLIPRGDPLQLVRAVRDIVSGSSDTMRLSAAALDDVARHEKALRPR